MSDQTCFGCRHLTEEEELDHQEFYCIKLGKTIRVNWDEWEGYEPPRPLKKDCKEE